MRWLPRELRLPSWKPVRVRRIPAPQDYRLDLGGAPPIQKVGDGWIGIDWWQSVDGPTVKIWLKANHPNMDAIPSNAPRTVKRLYKAEFQLYMLRMKDAGEYLRAVHRAEDDWNAFLTKRSPTYRLPA